MTDDEARQRAKEVWVVGSDDRIEVDLDAKVIHLEELDTGVEGWAWVQAWLLVEPPEVEVPARALEARDPDFRIEQEKRRAELLRSEKA